MSGPSRLTCILLLLVATGCGPQPRPLHGLHDTSIEPPILGARYDPTSTGAIRGEVHWKGAVPISHDFRTSKMLVGSEADDLDRRNPCLPRVAADNQVAGAIVYLRHVDFDRSRPWDLPPVRVAMNADLIHIEQGDSTPTGFVRAGDSIEMISENQPLEILRADGSAFFTLPFPEQGKPVRRRLAKPGVVELSSGLGHLLARSWLFVAEHPYYCRTDEEGHFDLTHVPDGKYELVCWLPDWRVVRYERDPENLYVSRIWFRPPVEKSIVLEVQRGKTSHLAIDWGIDDFPK